MGKERGGARRKVTGHRRHRVGQTSSLTVSRASGPEFLPPKGHGVGDSANRQTGDLTHT